MKNKVVFISSVIVTLSFFLALSGCKKDEEVEGTAKVVMTFDPRYEGLSIQIADKFINPQGYPVEYSGMKFYISNIELIGENGNVGLSEIEMINVATNQLSMEYEVGAGSYTGIQFNLGVPSEMNGTDNPDFMNSIYDENHPLSATNGMYWTWAAGYRFFSFEGKCDTNGVAGGDINVPFAFHSGRDTLFREIGTFNRPFTLSANQAKVLSFEIDLGSIFANEGDTIDLKVERQFHGSLTQFNLGSKFADNSASSIKLIQ